MQEKIKLNPNFHPIINSKKYYDWLYSDEHMTTSFVNGRVVKSVTFEPTPFMSEEEYDECCKRNKRRNAERAHKSLSKSMELVAEREKKASERCKKERENTTVRALLLNNSDRKILVMINKKTPVQDMAKHFCVSIAVMERKIRNLQKERELAKAKKNKKAKENERRIKEQEFENYLSLDF